MANDVSTTRLVLSERAEEARARIMSAYASYQTWNANEGAGLRRRRRLPAHSLAVDPLSAQMVISQIVAVAEHFSLGLLVGRIQSELTGAPAIALKLWEQRQTRVESSWETQIEAWKIYFALAIQDETQYKDLRPFIETRNSVMHGLGSLTRRQLNDPNVAQELRKANISILGTRLEVSGSHVEACRDVSSNFIILLDVIGR